MELLIVVNTIVVRQSREATFSPANRQIDGAYLAMKSRMSDSLERISESEESLERCESVTFTCKH